MRDMELQLANMLPKLPDDVTAVTLSAGILDREWQFSNMPAMVVTAAVLSSGMVVRPVQKPNMLFMVVTDAVLSGGTVVRAGLE